MTADNETPRALITGASGGLGGEICRVLAQAGCHIVAHAGRNTTAVTELVEDLRSQGASAKAVSFDVCDADMTGAALEKLLQGGPIQILVNNAGINIDGPMAGMNADDWFRPIDVSLNGFFNVARPLLMPMIKTRWGRIVAISSVSGILGNRGQANYAAAKAGLHGAVKSLSKEVASRGITVNAVAPGIIENKVGDGAFDPDRLKAVVPMKRAGRPREIADTVRFLVSREASYISGQIIAVDGGLT